MSDDRTDNRTHLTATGYGATIITDVICWDGDAGQYFAEDPRYPGCCSHGATSDEAKANLADARALYLEESR